MFLRLILLQHQEASVYECKLVFRYGVDFDHFATTLLIASGLWGFSFDFCLSFEFTRRHNVSSL